MSEERDVLVERLRERAGIARGEGNATATADAWHFEQAAAEITRLRAEVARMREALKPFAELLDYFRQESATRVKEGEIMVWEDHRIGRRALTVEMLEAALAARGPAE